MSQKARKAGRTEPIVLHVRLEVIKRKKRFDEMDASQRRDDVEVDDAGSFEIHLRRLLEPGKGNFDAARQVQADNSVVREVTMILAESGRVLFAGEHDGFVVDGEDFVCDRVDERMEVEAIMNTREMFVVGRVLGDFHDVVILLVGEGLEARPRFNVGSSAERIDLSELPVGREEQGAVVELRVALGFVGEVVGVEVEEDHVHPDAVGVRLGDLALGDRALAVGDVRDAPVGADLPLVERAHDALVRDLAADAEVSAQVRAVGVHHHRQARQLGLVHDKMQAQSVNALDAAVVEVRDVAELEPAVGVRRRILRAAHAVEAVRLVRPVLDGRLVVVAEDIAIRGVEDKATRNDEGVRRSGCDD